MSWTYWRALVRNELVDLVDVVVVVERVAAITRARFDRRVVEWEPGADGHVDRITLPKFEVETIADRVDGETLDRSLLHEDQLLADTMAVICASLALGHGIDPEESTRLEREWLQFSDAKRTAMISWTTGNRPVCGESPNSFTTSTRSLRA